MDRLQEGHARSTVVSVYQGDTLPSPLGFGGVVVTGSPHSVREEAPWMTGLGLWMLRAAEGGIPVLAICFGHQLLGEELGGRVDRNPLGQEVGTVTIETTIAGRQDPLFAGIDPVFTAQATHADALVGPPTDPRVVRLAGNANTTWQAFAVGSNIRAVQFHPELPSTTLSALLKNRGQKAPCEACPAGERILRNWDNHWVSGSAG
jgi:GMP synthase (glutamine-hydrolysing)